MDVRSIVITLVEWFAQGCMIYAVFKIFDAITLSTGAKIAIAVITSIVILVILGAGGFVGHH